MEESSTAPERWLMIPGFEGQYEASDLGRIRSMSRIIVNSRGHKRRHEGRILTPRRAPRNDIMYLAVSLTRGHQRMIHRLVLETFVGLCPEGMEGCHENCDSLDNRLVNLRWATRSQNNLDAVRHRHNRNTAKDRCPVGHVLTPPNLVAYFVRIGRRSCLACSRARAAWQKAIRSDRPFDFKAVADLKYEIIMAGVSRK